MEKVRWGVIGAGGIARTASEAEEAVRAVKIKLVAPPGIEPGTPGFSVRCSTI